MPVMRIVSPTKLLLPSDDESVKRFLTYTDRGVNFLIQKHKRNFLWKNRDPEGHAAKLEQLKSELKQCLMSYDEDGRPYTYSGLWKDLEQRFHWEISREYDFPVAKNMIPWANKPFDPYPYQSEAVAALIAAKHGAISMPTGSGKSGILAFLLKEIALKSVLFVPYSSIAEQLYKDFVKWFGKKYIGYYGGGKKETNKLITIGITQSLMRIEPGSKDWEELSRCQVLAGDESHLCAPDEFQKVSMGICANAPYRFFVSATQVRTDGSEMLLRGLTGPVCYSKDFRELVSAGYLADPHFVIFNVPPCGNTGSSDPKTETRNQLYSNPAVAKIAAQIADKMVNEAGKQVLIIIEEFRQAYMLIKHMTVPFEFAHGAPSKDAKEFLPKEYWECDIEETVKRFNAGETRVVIGSGAVSTGVDWKPCGCVIYLQGGTSIIKVKQAIGRGTRVTPDKKEVFVVDFNIVGSETMERHLLARREIYETMGDVTVFGE